MSYRNEPQKHSSGAKERLLFFFVAFATVAFFNLNYAQADTLNCDAVNPVLPCFLGTNSYSFGTEIADSYMKRVDNLSTGYGSAVFFQKAYTTIETDVIGAGYYSLIAGSGHAMTYQLVNHSATVSYQSVGSGINFQYSFVEGSSSFTQSELYEPNPANYQGSDYSLTVSSPQLSESSKADVQPSANFKIKFIYNVPVDNYSTTHFQLWTCPNTEFNFPDCTVISSSSIQSIRDSLTDADNLKNYIFAEAPVMLNEYTNLIAVLSDNRTTPYTAIYPAIFLLRGINDTSLPSANSATIEGGFVQDLGFWGNLFRSMFVPTSQFLNTKTTEIKDSFSAKFPALASMQASVSTGVNTLSSAGTTYTSPTMNLYGANNMKILDTTVLTPYIAQIKSWAGMFMWFFTAVFCFKAIRNLIHPKTD